MIDLRVSMRGRMRVHGSDFSLAATIQNGSVLRMEKRSPEGSFPAERMRLSEARKLVAYL